MNDFHTEISFQLLFPAKQWARACLEIAFHKMCFTLCGRFVSNLHYQPDQRPAHYPCHRPGNHIFWKMNPCRYPDYSQHTSHQTDQSAGKRATPENRTANHKNRKHMTARKGFSLCIFWNQGLKTIYLIRPPRIIQTAENRYCHKGNSRNKH